MSSFICSTSRSKKMEDVEGLKICSLPEKFYPYSKNLYTRFSVLTYLQSAHWRLLGVWDNRAVAMQNPLMKAHRWHSGMLSRCQDQPLSLLPEQGRSSDLVSRVQMGLGGATALSVPGFSIDGLSPLRGLPLWLSW